MKVEEAPDTPFAVGRFEVQLRRADGSRAPRSEGLDDKRRRRGRLMLCRSCNEYIYLGEQNCPHCAAPNRATVANDSSEATLERDIRNAIDEIERHSRRILQLAGVADEISM